MKRRFILELETDGMDYTQDMLGVADALKKAIPAIVRPYVRETAPAAVTYVAGVKATRKKAKK